MAILKNGINDGFTGKSGNTVTYMLNGKMVKRSIGKRLAPPTMPELANRQKTSITTAFLNPIRNFINAGFELEAKYALKTPYNIATSYIRLNAIAGLYPNQYVDFEKVLLSKGTIPAVSGAAVRRIKDGFEFTWDTSILADGMKDTDQVMLLVYIPGRKVAKYLINAGKRIEGKAQITIPGNSLPLTVETYLSFIAEDHKSIASSIYTGRFTW